MGIFLITLLVFALGILFIILDNHFHCDAFEVFGCLLSIIGGTGIAVTVILGLTSPDVNCFNRQYGLVLSEIDVVNHTDTVNVEFVSHLEDDVKDINHTISDNRKKEGTFWVGWYYSEEVGNYEYIQMPEFKNIKYNY